MKKLRIRESKVEAFMKKKGYKDIYDMKDHLLALGYKPEIVPDKTFGDKLSIVWWWVKKVLAVIISVLYAVPYLVARLLFGLTSLLSGIFLFLSLEPEKAARRFMFPFNPHRQ